MSTRIVATTLVDAHAAPSWHTELVTQLTNGVELEVLEEQNEWCRVRQRDGYESWAYAAFLGTEPAPAATHLVAEPTLLMYASPDASAHPPMTRLPIGTAVAVVEHTGEWSRLELVGRTGWVRTASLRALSSIRLIGDAARVQIVADARRLTGVYYAWGGCTAWGIDCSGLAQLTHRLAGHTLLRDARLQITQGRAAEPPLRPADLMFFCGETDRTKITHVAISTGGWRMIHSSRSRNGVYEEDISEGTDAARSLMARFVGARSVIE